MKHLGMRELQGRNKLKGYFYIHSGKCFESSREERAKESARAGLVFYNEKACKQYLKDFRNYLHIIYCVLR